VSRTANSTPSTASVTTFSVAVFDFRLQLLAELLGDVGREVAAVLEEEISDEFALS